MDALSEPCELAGLAVAISASIGVASYPRSGANAETLLKRAGEAMYKVKLGGRRGHPLESTLKRQKSES